MTFIKSVSTVSRTLGSALATASHMAAVSTLNKDSPSSLPQPQPQPQPPPSSSSLLLLLLLSPPPLSSSSSVLLHHHHCFLLLRVRAAVSSFLQSEPLLLRGNSEDLCVMFLHSSCRRMMNIRFIE
eukprot:955742-Rhodomonas_salina.3